MTKGHGTRNESIRKNNEIIVVSGKYTITDRSWILDGELNPSLQLSYHGKNDQKRKVHILNGKLTLADYKRLLIDYKSQSWTNKDYKVYWQTTKDYKSRTWTTKFTDRQQKTTKVGHGLQSLLIDNKRLQKSNMDYKVYWQTTKDQKSRT